MLRFPRLAVPLLLAASLGCDSPNDVPVTGLQGIITLGPVTPVCLPSPPCYQPVRGTFAVYRGNRLVASFTSQANGAYSIHLPPGDYRVVPRGPGPIPFPETQLLPATVRAGTGLTDQDLSYSTFLRAV